MRLFLFFIFLRIFTCLLYTCNISLYCIHTKCDILFTFEKKYDKYCTNFANVYNICQFLCVYNLYIKRANRLMNSYFNWFSELSFFLFFFLNFFYKCFLQSLPIWFELVFVFCFIILLRIFTCLLCTCNISLYCIHTKSGKYYIHLQKKKMINIIQILQMCITFANFYVFTI